MKNLSYITPDGQVTIPRSIMKTLEIDEGNDILIEIEDGKLVLKKLKKHIEKKETNHVYKAG